MKNYCILLICLVLKVNNTFGADYKIGNFEGKSGFYFQDKDAISIYRKSYRIVVYLSFDQILNFDTMLNFPCQIENEGKPSSICTMYNSIQEEVPRIQKNTLRNIGLDEDKFGLQESKILLYGDFNSEDFALYAKLPNGFYEPYEFYSDNYYDPARLYKSEFGSSFPDKLRNLPVDFFEQPFINENMSEINHMFHHWKSEMETLEKALIISKTGKIHPSILTPAILITALKYAKEKFKDVTVPFELDRLNYNEIINISYVKISIVNDKLLYDLEIPMIEPDNYRLYRLVPWPMKLTNQDAYFFVEPTEDFVAIKAHHHSYIPFKEDEIRSCKTSKQRKFCSVPSVMIDLEFPNTCEQSLISNNYRKNLFSVCTVKLIKFKETVWYRLDNENSWIFTTSQDSINITCLEKPGVSVALNNSGWIKLNSTCVAASEKVFLKPFQKSVETSVLPQFQLFKFNVADEVETFLKNFTGELDGMVLNDFGKKGFLNLNELKVMGTPLEMIRYITVSREKGNDNIWLWSVVILLFLLFVGYILYEFVLQSNFWRHQHSRLKEEFFMTKLLSEEEMIVNEDS